MREELPKPVVLLGICGAEKLDETTAEIQRGCTDVI
jgi:hypothetical protein